MRAPVVVYHTGHIKSLNVCTRISEATGFPLEHVKNYEDGISPITYGLFRDTDRIMRRASWAHVDYYYVDHGFWDRGHYDGNYRIVRNDVWPRVMGITNLFNPSKTLYSSAIQKDAYKSLLPSWAFTKLKSIPPKPTIVICAPALEGSMFFPFIKLWPEEWIAGVTKYMQSRFPEGNVYVSTKHAGNRLDDKWLPLADIVVAHDSNATITALEHNIPAINVSYRIVDDILETHVKYRYMVMAYYHQSKLLNLKCEYFLGEM